MKGNVQTILILCWELGCGLWIKVKAQRSGVGLHSDERLLDILARSGELTELRVVDSASVTTRPAIISLVNKLIDRFGWRIITHVVPPVHISPDLPHPGINHHS